MNNQNFDLLKKAADKLAKAADLTLKKDRLDQSRLLVALFEYNLTVQKIKANIEMETSQFETYFKQ